jgi:hypothetical protein
MLTWLEQQTVSREQAAPCDPTSAESSIVAIENENKLFVFQSSEVC